MQILFKWNVDKAKKQELQIIFTQNAPVSDSENGLLKQQEVRNQYSQISGQANCFDKPRNDPENYLLVTFF